MYLIPDYDADRRGTWEIIACLSGIKTGQIAAGEVKRGHLLIEVNQVPDIRRDHGRTHTGEIRTGLKAA